MRMSYDAFDVNKSFCFEELDDEEMNDDDDDTTIFRTNFTIHRFQSSNR